MNETAKNILRVLDKALAKRPWAFQRVQDCNEAIARLEEKLGLPLSDAEFRIGPANAKYEQLKVMEAKLAAKASGVAASPDGPVSAAAPIPSPTAAAGNHEHLATYNRLLKSDPAAATVYYREHQSAFDAEFAQRQIAAETHARSARLRWMESLANPEQNQKPKP